MKVKILSAPKSPRESVSEIVWSLACSYGVTQDKSTAKEIRKWANKIHGKPIPKAEFERELAGAWETMEMDNEDPEEMRLEPLVMAIRSALIDGKPASFSELVKRLKKLRYWRGAAGIFTGNHQIRHSKMEISFTLQELAQALFSYIQSDYVWLSLTPEADNEVITRFDRGEFDNQGRPLEEKVTKAKPCKSSQSATSGTA